MKRVAIIAALVVVALAAAWYVSRPEPIAVSLVAAERGPVTATVARPTAVHCHNLVGLSGGVLHTARARGVPTVVTLHDHWGFCHRNTLIVRPGEICADYRRCAECLPFVSDGADRRIPIRARNDFLAVELGLADLLVSPSRYLADR